MTGKGNGLDPAAVAKQAEIAHIDQMAQTFIGPVLIAAVNGCQKSLPQYPIDRLMLTMAAMIGKCFGEVLSIGDMGPTMRLRRMCAESFEAEMKKAVIRPLPMPGATEHMIDRTVGEQTAELMRKVREQSK